MLEEMITAGSCRMSDDARVYGNAVQYLSVLPHHPDIVITRDKKGFKDFDILVMTPAEFVEKAKE